MGSDFDDDFDRKRRNRHFEARERLYEQQEISHIPVSGGEKGDSRIGIWLKKARGEGRSCKPQTINPKPLHDSQRAHEYLLS